MTDDEVVRNLSGMNELDFNGWNKADWNGVFAQHHTDDVVVYGKRATAHPRHPGAHRCR